VFSPQVTEVDTRPVHVLWEILAAASAGAATAHLSGGSAEIGAAINTVGHIARQLDALPTLLSSAERQKLGFG
jgi:hypothetical protein